MQNHKTSLKTKLQIEESNLQTVEIPKEKGNVTVHCSSTELQKKEVSSPEYFTPPYEEWLTTIANTRLMFNSMSELENYLDNHSIHNNGIKRAYPTQQKLRTAYRDLKEEALEITDNQINLTELLTEYKKASLYYKEKLTRKLNARELALAILSAELRPSSLLPLKKKDESIILEIQKEDIDISILVLLLVKALPSYDSKDGDVTDIHEKFESMINLLNEFLKDDVLYKTIPTIQLAREESEKTRLMMIFHSKNILDTYIAYSSNLDMYETASYLKESRVSIQMEGYWNECDGTANSTDFWVFEKTIEDGVFFANKYEKHGNKLILSRYTTCFIKGSDGSLVLYMMHPEAMKHRVEGKAYTDYDHVWYATDMPDNLKCDVLKFTRIMSSSSWPLSLNLTRVADADLLAKYTSWMSYLKVVNAYEEASYQFYRSLYAITLNDLYIEDVGCLENGNSSIKEQHEQTSDMREVPVFYRISRDAFEGVDAINLQDNVGILTIGNKRYLAFDDIMLYIELSDTNMEKYGIEITNEIF